VAVKLYHNDCMPDTPAAREQCDALLRELAARVNVVSLSTDLALDDHGSTGRHAQVRTIAGLVEPRSNLAVQTAVLANARAFVGTYGGFSYLAPFHGVPALALYSLPAGFDRAHLAMAEHAFARIGAPRFAIGSLGDVGGGAIVDRVEALTA
jgi:hypothetical protein